MSTPMRAPDFADVSDRIPGDPRAERDEEGEEVRTRDDAREAVGRRVEVLGAHPDRLEHQAGDGHGRDGGGEADRQGEERAQRQRGAALDEGDADPGHRAELGADDHGADDEDGRVEQDADGGDEPGQHHERGERPVQLRRLRRPRRHLLPDDGVGGRALRLADGALHPVGDVEVDLEDGDRALALDAEVTQVAQDDRRLLAGEVDEDEIALGAPRRPRQVDEVARRGLVVKEIEHIVGQPARHDDAQVVHRALVAIFRRRGRP
jgi:hypothetical protein